MAMRALSIRPCAARSATATPSAGQSSAEREALIYFTGFAVLIALVILISIQDIGRLSGS